MLDAINGMHATCILGHLRPRAHWSKLLVRLGRYRDAKENAM